MSGRLLLLGAVFGLLLAGCSTRGVVPAPQATPTGSDCCSARGVVPATPATASGKAYAYTPHLIEPVATESTIVAAPDGSALYHGGGFAVHVSRDNGTTWQAAPRLYAADVADGLSVAVDADGTLYASTTEGANVDVARSTDQGKSWAMDSYAASAAAPLADRPWVGVGGGRLVLLVGDLTLSTLGNYEHCQSSADNGLTWTDRDALGSPGPAGGLAVRPDGVFATASQDGLLQVFAQGCLGGPKAIKVFTNATLGEELPVATDGHAFYTAAPAKAGAVEVGAWDGARTRDLHLGPPGVHASLYTAVAAHGDVVAVLWYGSTTDGDYQSTAFKGDFDVYVAVVKDFWGHPQVQVHRIAAAVHSGAICRNGLSCTAGRGPGDYFGVAIDPWGGVHAAFADDAARKGTYHVQIPPDLPGNVPPG